jgi:hypothetical protein
MKLSYGFNLSSILIIHRLVRPYVLFLSVVFIVELKEKRSLC